MPLVPVPRVLVLIVQARFFFCSRKLPSLPLRVSARLMPVAAILFALEMSSAQNPSVWLHSMSANTLQSGTLISKEGPSSGFYVRVQGLRFD